MDGLRRRVCADSPCPLPHVIVSAADAPAHLNRSLIVTGMLCQGRKPTMHFVILPPGIAYISAVSPANEHMRADWDVVCRAATSLRRSGARQGVHA